jgi:hypothetical protein
MNVLDPSVPSRAPRGLLLAGLVAGATLAAVGLRPAPAAPDLPAHAVARVNQQLIARDAWLRAVAAVAADRRTPLTDADRRRVLERLIDEELLVQHGVALGLVEQDRRLRSTLVSEVMLAAGNAARSAADDAALRRFYDEHRDFFAPAGRLRVQAWRLDAAGARAPLEPAVPDVLLPPAKLQAYLGPTLTAAALALAPGTTHETQDATGGRVLLHVAEVQRSVPPAFEQVREAVRVEAQRRADEAAVRALLEELRRRSNVVVGA